MKLISLGFEKIVDILVRNGANVDVESKFRRRTPLIYAVIQGNSK